MSKGIPIIPLRIENVIPTKSMEYFLSSTHWLNALTPPIEKHLEKLTDTVQTLLIGKDDEPSEAKQLVTPIPQPEKKGKKIKPLHAAFAFVAMFLVIVTVFFFPILTNNPSTSPRALTTRLHSIMIRSILVTQHLRLQKPTNYCGIIKLETRCGHLLSLLVE